MTLKITCCVWDEHHKRRCSSDGRSGNTDPPAGDGDHHQKRSKRGKAKKKWRNEGSTVGGAVTLWAEWHWSWTLIFTPLMLMSRRHEDGGWEAERRLHSTCSQTDTAHWVFTVSETVHVVSGVHVSDRTLCMAAHRTSRPWWLGTWTEPRKRTRNCSKYPPVGAAKIWRRTENGTVLWVISSICFCCNIFVPVNRTADLVLVCADSPIMMIRLTRFQFQHQYLLRCPQLIWQHRRLGRFRWLQSSCCTRDTKDPQPDSAVELGRRPPAAARRHDEGQTWPTRDRFLFGPECLSDENTESSCW